MKNLIENIENPALGCKVGRAYQMMLSQLAKSLKEAGLNITTGEYLVMRAVYSNPGAQQCEIAKMVGKDKAAICRCISTLERKGLLITESVRHKCRRVNPSEKAREIEPRIMEVAAQRHKALTDLTSPAELNIFTSILDKIITQ